MARNVEIKARIEAIEDLELVVAEISDTEAIEIFQDDTFFNCSHGRLKLRQFTRQQGELIFYQRDDQLEPTESFYVRSTTNDPSGLLATLKLAYGEAGKVTKKRNLYFIGRTRIHVDRVNGLGSFVELEVVLEDDENVEVGVKEADRIMQQLGIDKSQRIEGAYVDLIRQVDS
jgi:predicted adenylyl cyclase CyaB